MTFPTLMKQTFIITQLVMFACHAIVFAAGNRFASIRNDTCNADDTLYLIEGNRVLRQTTSSQTQNTAPIKPKSEEEREIENAMNALGVDTLKSIFHYVDAGQHIKTLLDMAPELKIFDEKLILKSFRALTLKSSPKSHDEDQDECEAMSEDGDPNELIKLSLCSENERHNIFNHMCQAIGMDPDAMRILLLRCKKDQDVIDAIKIHQSEGMSLSQSNLVITPVIKMLRSSTPKVKPRSPEMIQPSARSAFTSVRTRLFPKTDDALLKHTNEESSCGPTKEEPTFMKSLSAFFNTSVGDAKASTEGSFVSKPQVKPSEKGKPPIPTRTAPKIGRFRPYQKVEIRGPTRTQRLHAETSTRYTHRDMPSLARNLFGGNKNSDRINVFLMAQDADKDYIHGLQDELLGHKSPIHLCIDGKGFKDETLQEMDEGLKQKVVYLDLCDTCFYDFKILKDYTQLTYLYTRSLNIGEIQEANPAQAPLNTLELLNIRGMQVPDLSFAHKIPKLKTLAISELCLDDDTIQAQLKGHPSLKWILFGGRILALNKDKAQP